MMIEPTSRNENVVRGTDILKEAGDWLESTRAKLRNDPEIQEFVENAVKGSDVQSASANAFKGFITVVNAVLEVGDSGKCQ